MKKTHLKLIMELIFIFILPLLFICFTSEIQVEREFTYDNQGNYETSQDTKQLSFDNSIIKYTDGYKNVINNFNIWNEEWEIGGISQDTGENIVDNQRIRSKDYIPINPNTELYGLINGSGYLYPRYYDINKNFIGNGEPFQQVRNTTFTTMANAYYMKFQTYAYNDFTPEYINNICINISVSWANGNYVPYGKPLILITQNDIAGQNNINYTIWGNIKELLITNLDLNDNVLLDIVLCYTLLWITMWMLWHILYGFLELLIHIIPRKWERE